MGIIVPPKIRKAEVNSGEMILTENQYQKLFQGCTELTQCQEPPAESITPIKRCQELIGCEDLQKHIPTDGFDWKENERNAYEL